MSPDHLCQWRPRVGSLTTPDFPSFRHGTATPPAAATSTPRLRTPPAAPEIPRSLQQWKPAPLHFAHASKLKRPTQAAHARQPPRRHVLCSIALASRNGALQRSKQIMPPATRGCPARGGEMFSPPYFRLSEARREMLRVTMEAYCRMSALGSSASLPNVTSRQCHFQSPQFAKMPLRRFPLGKSNWRSLPPAAR